MDSNSPQSQPPAYGQQSYGQPPAYGPPPGYPPPGYGPPPGYPPPPGYGPPPVYAPPSAVGWVIVGFIFFWPLGIASLVAHLRISPAWYAGDRAGAVRAAEQARTRGKIALGIGIALFVLWIILVATLFASVDNACSTLNANC